MKVAVPHAFHDVCLTFILDVLSVRWEVASARQGVYKKSNNAAR